MLVISNVCPGVDRFVNFGHRPWWYGANFCQKARKKTEKNYFQEK